MNNLSNERRALYARLLSSVKNSPVETVEFEGNTFSFKCDYKLPYGESHYARVFSHLMFLKETSGIIKTGDLLLETTSGSGGRAAAAVATALGYRIKVAIPAGGEKAREDAIVRAGAELELTPAEAYVNGFPQFIKSFIGANPGTKYLNHAMGDIDGRGAGVNFDAIDGFRPFVSEVLESGINPDVVISPLGNGTTTLPLAQGFKAASDTTRIIGFESASSAMGFRKKFEGLYESKFRIDPANLPRHDLPGTTPAFTIFPMPAFNAGVELLDSIELVTSKFVNNNFVKSVGFKPVERYEKVVQWDNFDQDFLKDFGRTGRAGFAVAASLARREGMVGKHFLVPVFDAAWHYDT